MCPTLITILGPTASGKTAYATRLAAEMDAEIISADSRQVYKGLDIGSGKDLDEYVVDGKAIPYHGIDIVEPHDEFNVFQFQQLFLQVYPGILERGKQIILCGGTGFYLSAILDGKRMLDVPVDAALREKCAQKPQHELQILLEHYRPLHNHTDTEDRERLLRAIEIAKYEHEHADERDDFPVFEHRVIGMHWEPEVLRERIMARLLARLDQGLIEEVTQLRHSGVSDERLDRFGLEYRYVLRHLSGQLSKDELVEQLHLAICDYAKRQRTWFRRMERRGLDIEWFGVQ